MQKIKGKQQWAQEQKQLLIDLYPKFSSKKWKMISIEMAGKGFKRTQLECREKWINFLDPNLNNQDWSLEELQRLYNYHNKYGTRWCFMQKELNRTQNRIKNRFYGTIRNYIRLVMNTLCQRQTCFNTQINKISPSLLNDLYNSENIFDFLRGEIRKMIYRMKFKIDKKILRNRIRDKQHLYRELLGLIGSLFKGTFNMKFFDRIEESGSQSDEIEELPANQAFPQFNINIKNQDEKLKQKIPNQPQIDVFDLTEHKKSVLKVQDKLIIDDDIINQSQKQLQYLNAFNNNQEPKEAIQGQNSKAASSRTSNPSDHHIYPFLSHNPMMFTHQSMMDHAYMETHQHQLHYELLIEKIRHQNLMMMQQQQSFLLSQFANKNHLYGAGSYPYNN